MRQERLQRFRGANILIDVIIAPEADVPKFDYTMLLSGGGTLDNARDTRDALDAAIKYAESVEAGEE